MPRYEAINLKPQTSTLHTIRSDSAWLKWAAVMRLELYKMLVTTLAAAGFGTHSHWPPAPSAHPHRCGMAANTIETAVRLPLLLIHGRQFKWLARQKSRLCHTTFYHTRSPAETQHSYVCMQLTTNTAHTTHTPCNLIASWAGKGNHSAESSQDLPLSVLFFFFCFCKIMNATMVTN